MMKYKKRILIVAVVLMLCGSVYWTLFTTDSLLEASKTILSTNVNNGIDSLAVDASKNGSSTNEINTLSNFVKQVDYEKTMNEKVIPFLKGIEATGYFDGLAKLKIFYRKYEVPNSKASIVISEGWTETTEKFMEMSYYFALMGYTVYALDHRGQGYSGRLGSDPDQVHVENFDDYVSDFKTFLDQIVMPSKPQNLLLFAHSMGGCIGTRFIEKYNNYFDAVVLSTPMLEINSGKYPPKVAKAIGFTYDFFGFGKSFVLGQGSFVSKPDFENSATNCKERFDFYFQMKLKDKKLQTTGGSFQWFNESTRAAAESVKTENVSKIKIPVLLFQAEQDTYVEANGLNKFANASKKCEFILVKGAKHEIYREKDAILRPYLEKIMSFFKNYAVS